MYRVIPPLIVLVPGIVGTGFKCNSLRAGLLTVLRVVCAIVRLISHFQNKLVLVAMTG